MVSTTLTTIISQTSIAGAGGSNQHLSYSNTGSTGVNQHHFQRTQQNNNSQHSFHSHQSSTSTNINISNQRKITTSSNRDFPTLNGITAASAESEIDHSSQYSGERSEFNSKGLGIKKYTTTNSGSSYPTSSSVLAIENPQSATVATNNKSATQRSDLIKPAAQLSRNETNSSGTSPSTTRFLSSSSPLNDQISLLFPKCRPKNGEVNSNSDSVTKAITEASVEATTSPTPTTPPTNNNSSNLISSSVKSFNLIKQSPPPPSTPSPSSESLSSVTPRISTNPFLYPNLEVTNGESEIPAKLEEQQVALSQPYPPYFFHSSTAETNESVTITNTENYQSQYRYEMPRKRSNYNGNNSGHQLSSASSYQLNLVNGNSSINASNNHHSSQNPFIKDDCWESQYDAAPSNIIRNRSEFAEMKTDSNISYQGRYNHCLQQQSPHTRLGRSPVGHSELAMTSTSSQQQQHQEIQSKIQAKGDNQHMDSTMGYNNYHRNPRPDKISINHEIEWKRDLKSGRDDIKRGRERNKEMEKRRKKDLEKDDHDVEDIEDDRMQGNQQQKAMTVITDGEVVVFDDITDNWQNLRVTTESSPSHRPPMKLSDLKIENLEINNCETEMYEDHNRYLNQSFAINVDTRHGIIEYEGSPRRIGQITTHDDEEFQPQAQKSPHHNFSSTEWSSQQHAMYPVRPGFPQRITSPLQEPSTSPMIMLNYKQQQQSPASNAEDTSNDVSEIGTLSDLTASEVTTSLAATTDSAAPITTTKQTQSVIVPTTSATRTSTFDYLYEFSETRKVLEEFFKCPSNDEKPLEIGSDIDSVDIQYEFHSNLDRDGVDDDEDDGNDDDDEDQQPQQQQQKPHDLQTQNYQNHSQAINCRQEQQLQNQNQGQIIRCHSGREEGGNQRSTNNPLIRDFDFFLDSVSRSSGEQIDQHGHVNHNQVETRTNYHYSPETTDYDSNCGDLDSLSGELNGVSTSCSNYTKYYASSMPVLEDGLSSGHTSDTENNNNTNNNAQHSFGMHTAVGSGISILMDMKRGTSAESNSIDAKMNSNCIDTYIGAPANGINENPGSRESIRSIPDQRNHELLGQSPSSNGNSRVFKNIDPDLDSLYSISVFHRPDRMQITPPPPAPAPHRKPNVISSDPSDFIAHSNFKDLVSVMSPTTSSIGIPPLTTVTTAVTSSSLTSVPVTNTANRSKASLSSNNLSQLCDKQQSQKPTAVQLPPTIPEHNNSNTSSVMKSPVWVPRRLDSSITKIILDSSSDNLSKNVSADEEDVDTDLETDRLLGHQRLDDQGFYDDNKSLPWDRKPRSLLATSLSKFSPKVQQQNLKNKNSNHMRTGGFNSLLPTTPEIPSPVATKTSTVNKLLDISGSLCSSELSDKSPIKSLEAQDCVVTIGSSPDSSGDSGCDNREKDNTNGNGNGTNGFSASAGNNGSGIVSGSTVGASTGNSNAPVTNSSSTGEKKVKKSKNKEAGAVLIEGVLFRARYLGSTQLVCEGQPTKSTRMMQAEEAVSRIKAPDGDAQPSTEVDLFISTEKIMVLNTDLKEIMMDHALRTISYIADIGDLVVLMARRRFVPQDIDDGPKPNRTPKMICHVFESDEAQFIAQSIGQAFQVAYMEFLKANGIEDHSFVKEMDYQEVLNSQEIFGDELEIFAKKELQKEVVVPKAKGEILGVVIVESGWGSMLPTVVIANLMSAGAAARCGQLNIGDQLIAINGMSLVGLPLSTCQTYIKNTKNQTVVKFTVVPCAPVVEVKIKRPNTKYQLGFSVQNGVICSLLRGGIAERGGVRVGHRIIEINNQSVVAVPHEKIVNLLATSVGEILMKTMPTSMFRLLTGQENPIYI